MKVFKFGGASIKNPQALRNMLDIVKSYSGEPLLIVVSAMGKTTNALEKILNLACDQEDFTPELEKLYNYHKRIIDDLLPKPAKDPHPYLSSKVEEINQLLAGISDGTYDQLYDQVICQGELISSTIISDFFQQQNLPCRCLDARQYICTDSTFREGKIDWTATSKKIKEQVEPLVKEHIIITQGFIGSDFQNNPTTLGREGSDFSAAIFCSCLEADSCTIWKDVEGVLSADPKLEQQVVKYQYLSYQEAAEMTYYGASVIHPKTIKPLALKGIPLYVRSFEDPKKPGTKIFEVDHQKLPPALIHKFDQSLVSFQVKDFSFINEDNLSLIFHTLNQLNIKINMMQNSAISFSVCIDHHEHQIEQLEGRLDQDFEILYNRHLHLITIKNYDQPTIDRCIKGKEILLEQKTRSHFQALISN